MKLRLVILSVILILSCITPLPSAAPVANPFEGTWKLSYLEVNGKEDSLPSKSPIWVIKGDKILYGGEELGTFTVDTTTSPKTIDLKFASPKRTYEGIYTVEKDAWKICVNNKTEGVKERPHLFSTEGKENWRLLIFQKEDKAEASAPDQLPGFVGMMISVDADTKEVRIMAALKGSPAEKAGLKKDDVLVKVGGVEATDLQAVVKGIRNLTPGTELSLQLKRDGKELDVKLKVGVMPFILLD